MKSKLKKRRFRTLLRHFFQKIRANRISFAIYVLMGAITVSVIVLSAIYRNFESTFTASLTLILFLLPTFVEDSFHIRLPTTLEIIAVIFMFSANILGEIGEFYTRFPMWDNILHYTSGFMFAAFGFTLVDIFNRHRKLDFHLSPFFLALVALCFSVSVGVVWEFFEYGMDVLFLTDMQKDFSVTSISSAYLNPDGQAPVEILDIAGTVITTADGRVFSMDGYLDIGLNDTMKDLFVDFAGAFLFSVFGFFYARHTTKGRIVRQFIPQVYDEPDAALADLGEESTQTVRGEPTGED